MNLSLFNQENDMTLSHHCPEIDMTLRLITPEYDMTLRPLIQGNVIPLSILCPENAITQGLMFQSIT